MPIMLLDDSLKVDVFLDSSDSDFDDNICLRFEEDCPEDEKLFIADETNIYVTPDEACLLILALQRALGNYRQECKQE